MQEKLSELAQQYIQISEEIKEENDKLKDKKDKKNQLMKQILSSMIESNTKQITTTYGSIVLEEKEGKPTLNKKSISDSLQTLYENKSEISKVVEHIVKNTPSKKTNKIKIQA